MNKPNFASKQKRQSKYNQWHSRSGTFNVSNPMMAVIVTALFVGLLFAAGIFKFSNGVFTIGNVGGGTGNQYGLGPTPCVGGYAAPTGFQCGSGLGVTASLQDPLAGGGINSATVTLNSGVTQVDSITTGAAGTGSSAASTYTSGQQFWCKITATSYVQEEIPCTIPPVPVSAAPASTVTLPLYDYKVGTWSLSMVATGGSNILTGQQYNWASTGLTTLTLTITVTETVNNQGYKSTWDYINNIMNNLVLEVSDGGGASTNSQYMTITGMEYTSKFGTTNYWQTVLPDGVGPQVTGAGQLAYPTDSLGRYAITGAAVSSTSTSGPLGSVSGSSTLQLVGTTPVGGVISFPVQIGKGNLAASNTITLTWKIWSLYDANYFTKNGVSSPIATGASGAATQQGSSFTTLFKG